MAKKKMLSGNGWSFEPADAAPAEEVVSLPPEKQKVTLKLEKKPKGKIATRVSGVVLSDADRKKLAAELKKRCGGGGTDAADWIEVQGDHRDVVREHLTKLGWHVK